MITERHCRPKAVFGGVTGGSAAVNHRMFAIGTYLHVVARGSPMLPTNVSSQG
jgi:hypothetical protein